ncbi:hypothetical protein GGR53DRAFT_349964 [Hypoxylon sp. FL1150]|nr:hypothetical protein GGR53DRAFT_349964 [Hypoxylon sp. FL1150]
MSSIHYKSRMFNLKERLDISDTSWKMLKAYEDCKSGRIEENELGRMVRLSHHSRESMIDTILHCVHYMADQPQEKKHCVDIITAMGEMVKMRDQPPESLSFLFMELPREIRRMCLHLYLNDFMKHDPASTRIVPVGKKGRGRCNCSNLVAGGKDLKVLDFPMARTSKKVSDEFMSTFYQRYCFYFPCPCEMGYYLKRNATFKSEVRKLWFYWVGPLAATNISLLKKMEVYSLTISISKDTGRYLTEREDMFRQYFLPKRGNINCLSEAQGIDELLDLRGIQFVRVSHSSIGRSRPESERHALELLLRDTVTKPREQQQEDN